MDLIRDLLYVSAIKVGRVSLHLTKADLSVLVEETLRLLVPRIEESGVSVENSLTKTLPLHVTSPVLYYRRLVKRIQYT